MLNTVSGCGVVVVAFFFQAEDGIRDLVRSRGLGDVYKRQPLDPVAPHAELEELIQHLVRDLDASGYFVPPERTDATLRTLRTALTKTGWSHNDIRMMHGIITSLGRKPRAR